MLQATLALAAATVATGMLPSRLNAVIQPLMAGVRTSRHAQLREVAGTATAQLVALCLARRPCPNDK